MFHNTFNQIKTLVKDSFSLVKTATVGTLTAIGQDLSNAKAKVERFNAFCKWEKEQQSSTESSNAHAHEESKN